MSDKVRVYEIAEETSSSTSEVIKKGNEIGFELKSPQSAVSYEDAEVIANYITTGKCEFLKYRSKLECINIMERWFRSKYVKPKKVLKINETTNKYDPIYGELITPYDILKEQFSENLPIEYIELLSERLSKMESLWSPKPIESKTINYNNMISSLNSNEKIFKTFNESISSLELMVELHLQDKSQKRHLNYMIYANIFTTLENLLSDIFYFNLHGNNLYQEKFVESSGLFNEKIQLSQLFEYQNKIDSLIYEKLDSKVWHAFHNVKKYYLITFDISLDFSHLQSKVAIRHDIVHRNGKVLKNKETIKMEDFYHEINTEDIIGLINETKKVKNILYDNFMNKTNSWMVKVLECLKKDSFSQGIEKMTSIVEEKIKVDKPKKNNNDYNTIGKKYKKRKKK